MKKKNEIAYNLNQKNILKKISFLQKNIISLIDYSFNQIFNELT